MEIATISIKNQLLMLAISYFMSYAKIRDRTMWLQVMLTVCGQRQALITSLRPMGLFSICNAFSASLSLTTILFNLNLIIQTTLQKQSLNVVSANQSSDQTFFYGMTLLT